MGKGKSPTSEELEFIYRLFTEIVGDSDVVRKYDELEQHGKLGSLPFRHDIRFIRQRRREFEAARRVLEEDFRRRADPVLAERRKEHWDRLAQKIQSLWDALRLPNFANIISNSYRRIDGADESLEGHGWILEHTSEPDQPIIRLRIEKFDPLLFNGAISHLQAEFPEFNKLLSIWKRKAGILINRYLSLVDEIGKRAEEQTHIPIIDGYDKRGLRSALAFQVFYWVLTNFRRKGHYMTYEAREFTGGEGELSSLIEAEEYGYYQKVLASGSAEEIARCEDALRGLVDYYIEDERVGEIKIDNIREVHEALNSLTSIFSLVTHRKTFVGTCPICADW